MREWRDISAVRGRYQVSNDGRVRSLRKDGTWRELAWAVTKAGYSVVNLPSSKRTKRTHYIHALVAEAFIGSRPAGFQINHLDGCKANNRTDNLEYVTVGENCSHAWRTGLRSRELKLDESTIKEIRRLYATGKFRQSEIASRFSINQSHVSRVIRGKRRSCAT